MPANKIRTLAILLFATAAGMNLWFMTAAILPDLSAEAELTSARETMLSSAVQAGFVIGALAIAISGLADRMDPRRIFAACSVGVAISQGMLLLAPIDTSIALFLRFLAGALMAGVYPVGMKIVVGWGVKDRGLLVALLVGALTFGKSIPFGLAWLGGTDWRIALASASLIAALGGLSVLFAELGPHHRQAPAFQPKAIILAWTDRRIRAAYGGYLGHMWELFVFWAWVAAAATASYAARMPMADAVSLGKLTAFLTIAAGMPASIIAGIYADRFGKARIAVLAMAASGTLAIATAFAFGGPVYLLLALFILWGAAVIPDSAQFSALVADHAPAELAGSLLTFQTALGFLLTVLTVQCAPIVAEFTGWPVLLALLAAGPFCGLLAMRPLVRAEMAARQ